MNSKADLRRSLRAAIDRLGAAERAAASAQARNLLRRQPVWTSAQAILFYAPIAGEIDLTLLLEEAVAAGKAVALPGFVARTGTYDAFQISHLGRDCVPGKLGISEPSPSCPAFPLNRLDLALVPGLGFDLSGHRLGRGRGFYDRLLAGLAGTKCGVAFDPQIVARVPAETHDIRMNFILTPTRWLAVSGPGAEQP
ncbi:MAG: 5-formyltetrahydrofolate cyclo-ligase [Verrucomicrobiota bacterium]|jgi:5-formyltetrahydrofolate cyclo-ligase